MSGETNTYPQALFSLPLQGERCRGYVAYQVEELDGNWLFNAWSNYTHQSKWINYPMSTAWEHEASGRWNGMGCFHTIWSAVQFRPSEVRILNQ